MIVLRMNSYQNLPPVLFLAWTKFLLQKKKIQRNQELFLLDGSPTVNLNLMTIYKCRYLSNDRVTFCPAGHVRVYSRRSEDVCSLHHYLRPILLQFLMGFWWEEMAYYRMRTRVAKLRRSSKLYVARKTVITAGGVLKLNLGTKKAQKLHSTPFGLKCESRLVDPPNPAMQYFGAVLSLYGSRSFNKRLFTRILWICNKFWNLR